jgi:hypothetical protein
VGLLPSPVEFSSHHHFYKLSRSSLLGMCCRSCLLQMACEGFPSPPLAAQGALPSLLSVFSVVIAYYSVSLFSPGGGQSVQGSMLIWPRVVCVSTAYRLAHLVVCIFPSHLGTGFWQWHGSLPDFSI